MKAQPKENNTLKFELCNCHKLLAVLVVSGGLVDSSCCLHLSTFVRRPYPGGTKQSENVGISSGERQSEREVCVCVHIVVFVVCMYVLHIYIYVYIHIHIHAHIYI